jgi:hypothetical protein
LEQRQRAFAAETLKLVQLKHPCILPVADVGVIQGVPFRTTHLPNCFTLSSLLRQQPLSLVQSVSLTIKLANILHFAHVECGMIHRVLTPELIFMKGPSDQHSTSEPVLLSICFSDARSLSEIGPNRTDYEDGISGDIECLGTLLHFLVRHGLGRPAEQPSKMGKIPDNLAIIIANTKRGVGKLRYGQVQTLRIDLEQLRDSI